MKEILKVLLGLGVIILIIILLNRYTQNRFIKNDVCYTKTIEINVYTDGDGQRLARYSFVIDDNIYYGVNQLNSENEKKISKQMTIEYVCNKPKVNRLIFDEKSPTP